MKINILAFVSAAICLIPAATPAQAGEPAKAPTAAAADVDSIDHIVSALYDVISGPAAQKRNWDRFKSLFTSDAELGVVYETRSGKIGELDVTIPKYIDLSDPILAEKGFFEREISRKTEKFGHIANLFSTYESRYNKSDKPFERGINSIQLYNDGARWWIRSIIWESESPKLKIPKEYDSNGH